MRSTIISIVVLLFTLQSIAAVVEFGGESEHDQIHHQYEAGDFALEHSLNQVHDKDDHEGHHIHFCHHHHGEHNPQVLFHSPGLSMLCCCHEQCTSIDGFYTSLPYGLLYRPPIIA